MSILHECSGPRSVSYLTPSYFCIFVVVLVVKRFIDLLAILEGDCDIFLYIFFLGGGPSCINLVIVFLS